MDLKTLEYMKERVKKAENLVFRINELNKAIKKIEVAEKTMFSTKQHGNYVELDGFELVKDLKASSIVCIEKEIARLEKELAEL
ncbi:hypothetical protein [Niallia sp. Krafla_26]|uniref:hypothetical protein n=1 Tax=Niallia sp. Krafla_26 TaxID=3064703 RepID=UPI003D1693AD